MNTLNMGWDKDTFKPDIVDLPSPVTVGVFSAG